MLIGVFALSSIMLAVLGINIYKNTALSDSRQELDTAALYFAQKIRQCDDKSAIHIETLDDTVQALVIESAEDEQTIETWLFVYEGELKEINAVGGSNISTKFGQQITPLKSAGFSMPNNDLLKINLKAKGNRASTINLYLDNSDGGAQ